MLAEATTLAAQASSNCQAVSVLFVAKKVAGNDRRFQMQHLTAWFFLLFFRPHFLFIFSACHLGSSFTFCQGRKATAALDTQSINMCRVQGADVRDVWMGWMCNARDGRDGHDVRDSARRERDMQAKGRQRQAKPETCRKRREIKRGTEKARKLNQRHDIRDIRDIRDKDKGPREKKREKMNSHSGTDRQRRQESERPKAMRSVAAMWAVDEKGKDENEKDEKEKGRHGPETISPLVI